MTWSTAYMQGVMPFLWFYLAGFVLAAAVFLPLAALRRHLAPVVLLLVGRQVFAVLVEKFVPAQSAQPSWAVIGHFAFFIGMVHYIYVAAREYFDRFTNRRRRHSSLLRWIAYGTVMAISATAYLEFTQGNVNFGIGIASVAAVIGFALQETLANLFAGLTLEADPPFRVGDWIQGDNFIGEVVDITWRATRLRTFEQDTLVIPNRQLANAMIVNWTTPVRHHGVHLTLGAAYGDAPGRVKEALLTALRDCDGVLADPAPEIYTQAYGDFAVGYDLLFFLQDYKDQLRIKDRVLSRVWYQFRRDGIRIPFPIRDVNFQVQSARERQAEAERETARKIDILRGVVLLKNFPEEDLVYLAGQAHFHRYWKGETVIRQGDVPCFLSILVDGTAHVLLRTGDIDAGDRDLVMHCIDADGKEHTEVKEAAIQKSENPGAITRVPPMEVVVRDGYAEVSTLKPGDFFGEISVLLGQEASATVRSAAELLLLVVDREAFTEVLKKHPESQEAVCNLISKRVRYLHHITKLAQDQRVDVAEEPRTLLSHLRKFLRLTDDRLVR
ncbi:MAG: mechanosensitive ion channel domain-containing protein [Planctomycetota bacterium]